MRVLKKTTATKPVKISHKPAKIKTATQPSLDHLSNGHGHIVVNNLYEDRELLTVLTEVKNGNFKVRMPIDRVGIQGKICDYTQ